MEPTARRSRDPRDKRRVAGFGCTTPHANCVRQSVTQDDGLLIRAADKAPRPSCHFYPSCAAAGSGPWRGQRGRPGYAGHSPAHPPDFHLTAVPGNREALPAGGGNHAPIPDADQSRSAGAEPASRRPAPSFFPRVRRAGPDFAGRRAQPGRRAVVVAMSLPRGRIESGGRCFAGLGSGGAGCGCVVGSGVTRGYGAVAQRVGRGLQLLPAGASSA